MYAVARRENINGRQNMTPRIINNHLVIPTQTPGKLRAVFPHMKEAQVKGQTFCAVPYTLEAARVLNNIGMQVQSPIRAQYSWRGRFTPRWYQEDTAEFFTLNPRAHCHSAPRTGKTNSALWAADYLKKTGKIQKVLIVAPLSTLWDVWESAIFESFPLTTSAVLHGPRQKRLDLLAQPHDYYIVNHHGVKLIEKELAKRTDVDLVIIDESAVFRNTRAKTLFKPLDRVLNKQGIIRSAWGLTGTPIPNAPTDAFGQCKLITPENYHGHFTSFKRETMVQVSQFKWVAKRDHAQTVARILKPVIRFERSVCTDMEPCFIERRAQLSPEQQKAYKQLINVAATEVQGNVVTAVNAAVLISKLVQTACGCVIAADGSIVKMDYGPRLSVLEELIEENNEKVLVFVPFTGVLDELATQLRKRWSVAVVDGSVSARKRTQIFRDFRTLEDPHVLVCHPQVMAHGLDLTAATLSIWYAPFWKAEIYQQANARTDGSRQEVKIDIAHIYATAEERRIYTVLKEKGRLQDILLELSKGGK
jgi:SNF2 family DNA or RNA helicase